MFQSRIPTTSDSFPNPLCNHYLAPAYIQALHASNPFIQEHKADYSHHLPNHYYKPTQLSQWLCVGREIIDGMNEGINKVSIHISACDQVLQYKKLTMQPIGVKKAKILEKEDLQVTILPIKTVIQSKV